MLRTSVELIRSSFYKRFTNESPRLRHEYLKSPKAELEHEINKCVSTSQNNFISSGIEFHLRPPARLPLLGGVRAITIENLMDLRDCDDRREEDFSELGFYEENILFRSGFIDESLRAFRLLSRKTETSEKGGEKLKRRRVAFALLFILLSFFRGRSHLVKVWRWY